MPDVIYADNNICTGLPAQILESKLWNKHQFFQTTIDQKILMLNTQSCDKVLNFGIMETFPYASFL
jgi:hypothetical protein